MMYYLLISMRYSVRYLDLIDVRAGPAPVNIVLLL